MHLEGRYQEHARRERQEAQGRWIDEAPVHHRQRRLVALVDMATFGTDHFEALQLGHLVTLLGTVVDVNLVGGHFRFLSLFLLYVSVIECTCNSRSNQCLIEQVICSWICHVQLEKTGGKKRSSEVLVGVNNALDSYLFLRAYIELYNVNGQTSLVGSNSARKKARAF